MTGEAKQKLKQECIQIKTLAGLKIIPVSNDSPAPFKLQVTLLSPNDCKVDIPQLVYELKIDSPEVYSLNGIFLQSKMNGLIPRELLDKIEKRIREEYKELYEANQNEWHLFTLVEWTISNYQSLASSLPSCLEFYMSEGPNGESIRRWALKEQEQSSGEDDLNDEAKEYWRKRREDEEKELVLMKEREAEERRKEVENDPSLFAKVRILSLKEQRELKEARNKQGVRMAKTGPKRKKYQGEGSAMEKGRNKSK